MACGSNEEVLCDLPAPAADPSYAQAASGAGHTEVLGSGGGAVACGLNEEGQRDLLAPPADLSYEHAAAGGRRRHGLRLVRGGSV